MIDLPFPMALGDEELRRAEEAKKNIKRATRPTRSLGMGSFWSLCKDGHTNKTPPNLTVGSVSQRRR